MTYAPKSISDAMAVWTSHGGVNLGIVGNTAHKSGYHLGKDRIFGTGGQGWNDYSVKLARDKNGLSNAASAMDLGKLGGSYKNLQKFSNWLVARALKGETKDIREIIYSPDGVYVKRWSGPDNKVYTGLRKNADGSITVITPGNGDATHLTHTHISFYRDSESRDKTAYFAPYFETALSGEDMPNIATYLPGYTCTVKGTSNIRSTPAISSTNLIRTVPSSSSEKWTIVGWVKGGVDPESGSDQWVVRWNGNAWEYTAKVNLIAGPDAPVAPPTTDGTPYNQADLDKAVADATAPLTSTIESQATTIANQKTTIAELNLVDVEYTELKTALKKAVN